MTLNDSLIVLLLLVLQVSDILFIKI